MKFLIKVCQSEGSIKDTQQRQGYHSTAVSLAVTHLSILQLSHEFSFILMQKMLSAIPRTSWLIR